MYIFFNYQKFIEDIKSVLWIFIFMCHAKIISSIITTNTTIKMEGDVLTMNALTQITS